MSEFWIKGAGLAGRVLERELRERGIRATLMDKASFPREKVCGGVLQKDSWDYLNDRFGLQDIRAEKIRSLAHFWRKKKLSEYKLKEPMVFVSRFTLDARLQNCVQDHEPGGECLDASGAPPKGRWIGFHSEETEPVPCLQMHYGRGICAGVAPAPGGGSHLAFVIRRDLFQKPEELRSYLRNELGLGCRGTLKGTGRIHYGASRRKNAVGDAKFSPFPFLGLGMKHAISSAQLMAQCIARGKLQSYDALHRRKFWRYRWTNAALFRIYDSPFQAALIPFLRREKIFHAIFDWLHGRLNGRSGMEDF